MKSFTIHKLDAKLAESLELRARREGLSVNQTVKILLSESLGLKKPSPVDHRADFEDLAGSWSEAEARAFEERVNPTRTVDPADWSR
tara:strand:- start:97 stop:357 length:261 start_codon:yes stop_codon:yes gene_type:complete